jgi:hypothetical protein
VLVVLLAAAAHDDQVPAVRHDRRARAAAFLPDEEPAGCPQAEDRDHRLGQLVLRLHEVAVSGQPALYVVDPGGVVELDPLRRGERLVDGYVQAAGPLQVSVRRLGQREQGLLDHH